MSNTNERETMNRTQNVYIWKIREIAKVSETEASKLREVIDNEGLLDWSEASNSDIRWAIQYARNYMVRGWAAPA
jgi:hypothetical protein